MKRSPTVKALAFALIASLQLVAVPLFAADETATISGAILESATQAPLSGARLHVADPKTGDIYSSGPSTASGAFTLKDVPPATYELAVESGGGLFLVNTPIRLAPGRTQTLNLAVSRDAAAGADGEGGGGRKAKKKGWDNPGTAAGIVFGTALAVGILVNEATEEDTASVSVPQN